MNRKFVSSRQKFSEERIASYGAEQRRLKEAAAARRAAAADAPRSAGAKTDRGDKH
jgi:hypothetical protein